MSALRIQLISAALALGVLSAIVLPDSGHLTATRLGVGLGAYLAVQIAVALALGRFARSR